MHDPLLELQHYGVPGMKWGVRRNSPQRVRRLTNKANKLAWKAEKIERKASKKLTQRIQRDRKHGISETHERPDQWIKAIKTRKKAQAVLDKLYPELAKISWSDLEKQSIYNDIKYWKTPKWA